MPLRSLILDHLWLKLFSLVLATLIWMAVHANLTDDPAAARKTTRQFLDRPVLLLTETAARKAFRLEPAQASIFVQGRADVLNMLREEDIQVFVRLNSSRPADTAPVRVHVPAGVTVFHINPLTVAIKPAEPR